MNKASFVFLESFREQLAELEAEDQLRFYNYIADYGLFGAEPELTGLECALWLSFKNAMDYTKARREKQSQNGAKGGRGNKATESEQKPLKANKSETTPNKATESEQNLNVNVNVNEDVNVNGNVEEDPNIDCSDSSDFDSENKNEPNVPDEVIELARLLYSEHKKLDPKYAVKVSQVSKWAFDIEKLNRIDGRSYKDIKAVILWVKTAGNFWSSNIMSGKKLREQFPRLFLEMQQKKTGTRKDNFDFNKTGGGNADMPF